MNHRQQGFQERTGGLEGLCVHLFAESGFDGLQQPSAEIVPEEFIDAHQGVGDAEFGEMVVHRRDGLGEFVVKPSDGGGGGFGLCFVRVGFPALDEAVGVPDFRAEVASLLDHRLVVEDVVAGRRAEQHSQADGVGPVLLNQFERVGRVAQGLAHLAAQFVANDAGEIDVAEGHVVHKLIAGHDHTGHPEEEDVRSGHEVVGRIVVFQVGVALPVGVSGFLRIEDADGPEPTGKPGVEHILVLMQVFGLDGRIQRLRGLEGGLCVIFHHIAAVRQIPGGNPLAPPQLTGDAPVADIFHPVLVGVAVFVGNQFDLSAFHAFEGILRQGVHLEEPLGGEFRLDDGVGPFGITDRGGVIDRFFQVSRFLQHFGDFLPGDETVFADQDLRVGGQAAVVVDDVDDGQVMPQADFIVVDVVGGGHFQAARSEIHFDITVFDDGDLLVDEGDEHFLAFQPVVAFVGRVDTDGGIRHNRFRTGGGHDDVFVGRISLAVGDEIAHMVEFARGVAVDDFFVADGGQSFRVPVDHTDAFVDVSFLIEIDEGIDDGFAQVGVHRELGAVPVATGAEFAQLAEDNTAVLFLPFPGVFEEFLAGEVFLADAFGLEFGDDLAFGGDAGVVRARDPAGVFAVHPRLADEHVVERVVEYVSHMQDARDVGRGNHDGVGRPIVGLGVEKLMLQPVGVPFVFDLRGVIVLRLGVHLLNKYSFFLSCAASSRAILQR